MKMGDHKTREQRNDQMAILMLLLAFGFGFGLFVVGIILHIAGQ